MHRILIVLLMLTAGMAHARILHVGDNTIKLSQTKTTTPALHIRVGDEVWYGAMVPTFVKNTLHVRYNNVEYSVLQCVPFTDTTNYTYDEFGRLIGANKKNYLEGNGTQWISTKILPSISLKTHIGVKMNKATGNLIFGRQDKIKDLETYRLFNYQEKIYFDINGVNNRGRIIGAANSFMNNKYYEFETGNKYVKDLNSGYVISGSPTTEFSFTPEEKHTINLYGDENYTTAYASGKIYFFKMWDNDTLVRHFVPVPCGLKIGDFIVPENGMWDIVEQKFYGNMGTGEFIYGVDE